MISLAPKLPCLPDYYYGYLRDLYNGVVYGNSNGADWDWNRDTIVAGTTIGMMLDFSQDGTATVTAYKDGVRAGVMSSGSLRGPLCPAVWFCETDQSIELLSSNRPPS